jgi:hypothetical protein
MPPSRFGRVQELPAVVTIEAATAKGAPVLWADAPGNIAAQTEFGKKDVCDAAFAKAKHVTKLSLYNQRLVPVSMEPAASIAEFDAREWTRDPAHQLPESSRVAKDVGGVLPQGTHAERARGRRRRGWRVRDEDAVVRGRTWSVHGLHAN